jgi:hypothetical protein
VFFSFSIGKFLKIRKKNTFAYVYDPSPAGGRRCRQADEGGSKQHFHSFQFRDSDYILNQFNFRKGFRQVRITIIRALSSILPLLFATSLKAEQISDPCAGPSALLAVIDRPTASDSACVVKPGHLLIEGGYQYQKLHDEGGYSHVLPQAEFRLGLPFNNEFSLLTPEYINQHPSDSDSLSGGSATVFGLKHQIGYTSKLVYTVEGIITTPSGSPDFGSDGWGVAFNGIVNYNVTSSFGVAVLLGLSSQTDPKANGGGRYNTFNPDIVLTWQPTPKSQIYGEVYGQTRTSATENSGYNMDAGIQYLVTPNIEIDAEYGLRLSGNLGGFSHYFGAGGAVMF